MALQGEAYNKTTWSVQERPVPSTKLNQWDDNIESALELAYFLLSHAWGGGSGVVRGATTGDLHVKATSPVSMDVTVDAGYAFIDDAPFKLAAQATLPTFTAPATNPRIDTVQAKIGGWAIEVLTGTESATPAAPAADADAIRLASVYMRPGMTSIKDTDDATNGYIIDDRTYM